jgi:Domain of unknown function (DUF4160)
MPIISTFFGIIIRMYFGDHNPPHFHVEFQGENATFDFNGQLCWNYFRRDIPETGSLVREYSNRQSTFDQ